MNSSKGHCTSSDGSGFVQHHCVNSSRALQNVDALNDNSHLGCATASHHECSRCGKAKRTRTRNDEHTDSCGKCLCGVAIEEHPGSQCGQADGKHRWYKNAGHLVGNTLHRSFSGLCVTHQLGHAGKCGFRAHACGTY